MTDPKRSAKEADARSEVTSFIRPHPTEGVAVPPPPQSSTTELAASAGEADAFIERWIARHFSMSVRLHDERRELAKDGADDEEMAAILSELDIVQGVLLELHHHAENEPRVRALMSEHRLVQHGVVAVYSWVGAILAALPTRSVHRGRPSFVDEGAMPSFSMLDTLERLHPDLERLVRPNAIPTEPDTALKLSICFRQIGAAIVRISGRKTSTRPPPHVGSR